MAQRFDIPQLFKVYSNIPDSHNQSSWLADEYSYEGKVYMFVQFSAGQYIRKGTSLYVNFNRTAVISQNAGTVFNAVADWDIDASLAPQYSLVVKCGHSQLVALAPDSITSVFEQSYVVNYVNGQVRVANASFTLPVTYVMTDTATCVISLQRATDANTSVLVNVGDVVNTNIGVFGTIAKIANGSTIVLGLSSQGQTNGASVLCIVTQPIGTGGKGSAIVTCSNPIWQLTIGGTTGYPLGTPATGNVNSNVTGFFNQVNVCSSGTVMFVNSCVSGQMIKVGDILTIQQMSNYSNRAVTSINNAYAFTVNAAASAENSFVLGQGINVNSKFIMTQINPF